MLVILLAIILFANALPFMNPSTKHIREDLLRIQTHKERQGITYPKAQWFTQELDHFNVQERRTWQQRYFVNDTFFQKGKNGPIFVQVGGEGAISPGYVVDLMMAHYAAAEGALILALEHRFYGESHPFPTLDTPNLVFLTSEQALADLSVFLAAIKKEYPTTGPIITFGGSYPGNLASWFRLKYPHVTKGAIASSAPVLAVLDMISYLDVVEKSLEKLGGIECDKAIQNATAVIQDFLRTQEGRKTVENLFNTCGPMESGKDVSTFMSNIMGNWMGVVQYNQESPRMPNITGLCAIMTDKTNDPFANYLKVANSFLPPNGCLPVSYTDTVKQLQDINAFGPSVGERQWTYQTCTEFGYFQSTDSVDQPFGNLVPLSYYTDLCKDVFGFNWLPRIDETNIHYGGLKPGSTNVVFVNGNVDPWHSLSILESQSDTLLAILIDGTAHCANMKPATPTDPPGLAKAQQQIAKILHGWVSK